jgi:hypothetical protein
MRVGDTLKGSVQVKGQGRIDYLAVLAQSGMVRVLLMGIHAPGANPSAQPVQRIRLAVHGDTVLAETPSGNHRIPTKSGAVPMFNNALALAELFTRRAQSAGGVADIPYFAIAGGTTLMVTLRPINADSISMAVAGQVQRLKVDATGRILGGVLQGTPLVFDRAGPGAADGLTVTLRDSAIAPKADYSAPPGAPYTAEDVTLRGPSGTLGGTLTKPTNADRESFRLAWHSSEKSSQG